MLLKEMLLDSGWDIADTVTLLARDKQIFDTNDLLLTEPARSFLRAATPGLYLHQKEAIRRFIDGSNVCMTTGTSSGKSLPFYAAGINQLALDPSSKIIAIYPMKALGYEQEERWKQAIAHSGLLAKVGRIDGQVPTKTRLDILRRSSVIILTPDIIHAWLLNNLEEKAVLAFLKHTELLVVDEVHSYTGVFGSNSAFLFRRLQHALDALGSHPSYICASATIANPEAHLSKLFGVNFELIGADKDTSPRHHVDIQLATPRPEANLLSQVTDLLRKIAEQSDSKFIAFVDSRKQAEHISSILARSQTPEDDIETPSSLNFDHLRQLNVLPFRSGFEEQDRVIIQERLKNGSLRGIVSTSALELGMDIAQLGTGILVGVPRSSTSLFQRIGRIGRHGHGTVIIVNTGTIYDEAIFKNPQELLQRPMAESSLYLENARIQYIHALCLARQGGEHDKVQAALNKGDNSGLESNTVWPTGFLELCRRERLGEVSADLQNMKAEAGEEPNRTFPLRDVESQFKIELKQGPEQRQLGGVSHGQMMREAYPGAIYYYIAQPYRVYSVDMRSKIIRVRREKNYTTRPRNVPTCVYPNLTDGNIHRAKKYDNLIAVECNLQIREAVSGFKERRGPNENTHGYPILSMTSDISFGLDQFVRNYFTTGVVLTHPVLNQEGVDCNLIASLFHEAFLMMVPFERQDIGVAVDKHRAARENISQGDKFIALHDQTYGSLRLSGRVLEEQWLVKTLSKTVELCRDQEVPPEQPNTLSAVQALYEAASQAEGPNPFDTDKVIASSREDCARVILPGSRGIKIDKGAAEEFEVEDVFYHPSNVGLSYRGKRYSVKGEANKSIVPVASLQEIPGESLMGYYDYNTGEITPD